MVKINSRCFIVEVNYVRYVVKYGKIDEFLCLFLPDVVTVDTTIVKHNGFVRSKNFKPYGEN